MSDRPAVKIYEEAGMGRALPRGLRPAVLVVDFSCGFTDPAYAADPISRPRSRPRGDSSTSPARAARR